MTTLDIIKDKLGFLMDKYSFAFAFNNNSCNPSIFTNQNGYEWKQFNESEIFMEYNVIFKKLG